MNSGRPLVRIAHAYGNDRQALQRALSASVDMIEADIWFRAGEVWVRHERRLGLLPLLVDKRGAASHSAGALSIPVWPGYYIRPDVHPLGLAELLDAARGKRRLLLDVKGRYDKAGDHAFAAAVARQMFERGAEGEVAVCGQNWSVLDRMREVAPQLEVRYSIERQHQWEAFLRFLSQDQEARRVCIEHRFMSPEKALLLEEKGVDVYCWTVDDAAEAQRLAAAGVDGIISNDLSLLASLGGSRAAT